MKAHHKLIAFAAVTAACLLGAALYAEHAARRDRSAAENADPSLGGSAISALPDGATRPFMLFRNTALGPAYGRATMVYLDDPQQHRYTTPLQCDRLHYAAGHGICLEARRGVQTNYLAHIFDASLAVRSTLPLAGPPSRARISPDGRLAAVTVFTSGHSYSTTDFSTRTSIVDAVHGRVLVDDLEKLDISRDGARFKPVDANLWGVTFARDGDRFYATMSTGGTTYLVQGSVTSRSMKVVLQDVECPSLSPDEQHVAFKRRVDGNAAGRFTWRLFVLDVSSGSVKPLEAETRNVDDQVEWLDGSELLYSLSNDGSEPSASNAVWAASISSGAGARQMLRSASSPAIVRGAGTSPK